MKAPGPKSRQINPTAASYRLRVAHSALHRYGVFALGDIPRGRRVIEYAGKRLAYGDADKIGTPADTYIAMMDFDWCVDGGYRGRSSVHQPFVPAQPGVAMHPRPPLFVQPAENSCRQRTDSDLPLRDQNPADPLPPWSAAVPRRSPSHFELTIPSRKSSPAMRRTVTPGASRYRLKVRRSPIHRGVVFAEEAIPLRRKVIQVHWRTCVVQPSAEGP
jgi:hypothetical protein